MLIASIAKRTSKGDRQITINIPAESRLDLPRDTPVLVAGRVKGGAKFTYEGYYTFSKSTNQNHRLYGGEPSELADLIPFGLYGDKNKILVELTDLRVRSDLRELSQPPVEKTKVINGSRLFDRALILKRWEEQGFKCAYCDLLTQEKYIEGDHRIAVKNGGPTEPWNCVAACSQCNAEKGTLQPEVFARKKLTEQVFRNKKR